MRLSFFLLPLLLLPFTPFAQRGAIGQWQSHYPYNVLTGIATDGDVIYAAADQGFFTYHSATGEMITHSKVDGMSDAGTDKIGYDTATATTVITYRNGNIDLYRNGAFFNIPSIRLRPAGGAKTIFDVYCTGGIAYISTSIGAVVIDLKKQEVKENYVFNYAGDVLPIQGIRVHSGQIYAATPQGLYRASLTGVNLQDFASWQPLLADTLKGLAFSGGQLWLHSASGVLRYQEGAAPDTVFRSREVMHIDPALNNGLTVTQIQQIGIYIVGRVRVLDAAGAVVDSFRAGTPQMTLQLKDGAFYAADNWEGLLKRTTGFNPTAIAPSGPYYPYSFKIAAHDRQVRVLHGSYNLLFQPVGRFGWFSDYDGTTDTWKTRKPFPSDVSDLIDFVETAAGTYYGSMRRGLYLLKKDSTIEDLTPVLEPYADDPSGYQIGVMSMTKDRDGNLIVGQYKALEHELAVLSKSGRWTHLAANGSSFVGGLPRTAAGLLTDDFGQLWWFQPRGGGVFVYDMNGTPENPADDKSAHLATGKGTGGLPSASVLSMAKDQDGNIWIGTDNGMAVVNCPGSVIGGKCEATQPILKLDQFAGKLFDGEQVNTIAIDGANRKWVGTNNGVWLITPDAQQVVERFTVDNSPLPDNVVQRIAVDDVTGDVYIGTSNGLVSYRGTATEGSETAQTIRIFPNPVRSDYRGPIAFANLPTNADVRITDISGQLVYRTTANGGQAVWNGMDYTGRRPQTGVYLVFVTSKDGLITTKGKFVFAE